jgi:tRNA wybutosine-synthesizing protein 3
MRATIEVDEGIWRRRKEEFLRRMREDLEIGYLDHYIVDVLEIISSMPGLYTQSSCSGRVTLVDAQMPWEREGATVVFKKHSKVTVEEILYVAKQPVSSRLWVVVTGPIIHVSALSLEYANEMLKIAREAGMKHSGIISMSKKGIIVELTSGVRVTHLIKDGEKWVTPLEKLPDLVRVVNDALLEGKSRLDRLRAVLSRWRR